MRTSTRVQKESVWSALWSGISAVASASVDATAIVYETAAACTEITAYAVAETMKVSAAYVAENREDAIDYILDAKDAALDLIDDVPSILKENYDLFVEGYNSEVQDAMKVEAALKAAKK